MSTSPADGTIYAISDQVVAREIEGEMIIVPVTAEVGDMEDALYTLNETGREIWSRIDGRTTFGELVASLAELYDASVERIQADIGELIGTLVAHRMLVEVRVG
jgi:hypothetical protein